MKKIMFALIATASIQSFAASQYITTQVCNTGESGIECQNVTYKKRAPSAPTQAEEICLGGEVGAVECATNGKVPKFFQKIQDWADKNGFTPVEQDNGTGGPS